MTFYKYKDVENAAWKVLDLEDAPEKQPAFRARLKYLQREGMIDNSRGGAPLKYDFAIAFQIICALKLQEAGSTPIASSSGARAARDYLHEIQSGSPRRFLLLKKGAPEIVEKQDVDTLIAQGMLVSVVDLKLLSEAVTNALIAAEAMPRQKLGRPPAATGNLFRDPDG